MRHRAQKGFRGIFFGITQHQKGYIFLRTTQTEDNIFVRCYFYESSSSSLTYMSQRYAEAVDTRPAVSYIPYAASSREQTGDIIMFAQFEEGKLLY